MAYSSASLDRQQGQLTTAQRCVAAGGASLLAILLVNPLDVVKTRMQVQSGRAVAGSVRDISTNIWLERYAALLGPAPPVRSGYSQAVNTFAAHRLKAPSTWSELWRIVQHEGPHVLWRGTNVAVLTSVPLVATYLPLYDYLHTALQQRGTGDYSPVLAGCLSRTAATFAVSPLELIKTRMQAAFKHGRSHHGHGNVAHVWRELQAESLSGVLGRVRTLWKGSGVTLAKDVPFAALYWAIMEPLRSRTFQLVQERNTASSAAADIGHIPAGEPWAPSLSETVFVNATAGAVASGCSAALTTPFDVVKTRLQTASAAGLHQHSGPLRTLPMLRDIVRQGGVRGLFTGLVPRVVRTGAAYAILMTTYEVYKHVAE